MSIFSVYDPMMHNTNGFYIKPVLFIIAKIMVVMIGTIGAIFPFTFQGRLMRQSTFLYCLMYGIASIHLETGFLSPCFFLFLKFWRCSVCLVSCFVFCCEPSFSFFAPGVLPFFWGISSEATFGSILFSTPFLIFLVFVFLRSFHFISKIKHPRRLVVHCYHTSRQPPRVQINNSTAHLFEQLFYLCGRDIIAQSRAFSQ